MTNKRCIAALALAVALAGCAGAGPMAGPMAEQMAGQGPGPAPGFAPPAGAEIRALPGGEILSFGELSARVAGADLVVIGELHDDPAHQAMQAALIAATRAPAAAFEMVPATATAALADLRAGGDPGAATDAARAAADWDDYAPWRLPIAALAADAPAIGAGQDRAALIGAMKDGAAGAFDGDAARYGLDAALPAAVQASMEAEQMLSHCNAMPVAMAPAMVEAQRLRDAAFADALVRAGDARVRPGPAILVTGNGHARRDRGSPVYLMAAGRTALVIGQVSRSHGAEWRDLTAQWQGADGAPAFDVVILSDRPAGRADDPCAAFAKAAPPKG
jgi:uncharacterized iron-regulated protein